MAMKTHGKYARTLKASLALALAFVLHQSGFAQSPGVPALPSTNADYVDYAVDSLPSYFQPGTDVGVTNNTPADNPITNAGATVGRALFYDQRLSHNDSTSCASCHVQRNGFSDPEQFSEGFEGGLTGRHSMGLSNAMFYERGRFFWDERAATLEEQVLGPIQDSVEMGTTLSQLRTELADTEFYPVLFNEAFGSTEITDEGIANALAQFVRSMASYQSKYDQARDAGPVGSSAYNRELTSQEQLGSNLFHAAGSCSACHESDAQIADRTRNIGLDLDNSADEGAGDGQFKVPSLRNIAVREGYMHDGRFETLEEVIDFYSTGIQDNPDLALGLREGGLPTGDPIQFNFTENEKAALIAFLETLTDDTFLTSELFSDPFVELAGDFDGSGLIDSADVDFWNSNWQSAGLSGSDFLAWQRNLGRSWEDLAIGASISSVPEPATATLAIGALLLALTRRRRGHT